MSKENILESTLLLYRQTRKTIIILIWLLIVILIIAFIFQIWNGYASINMLQTASPNDIFKENIQIYNQYQNVSIGSIVMSSLLFLTIIFLLASIWNYFRIMKKMFIILQEESNVSNLNKINIPCLIQIEKETKNKTNPIFTTTISPSKQSNPSLQITPFD